MSKLGRAGLLAVFAAAGLTFSVGAQAQTQIFVQDIEFNLDEGGGDEEFEELAPERLAADNWQLRAELEMMREREAAAQRRIADLEERLLRLERVAGLVGAERLSEADEAQMRGQGFGTNVMAPIYRGNQIELTRGNPNFVQTTPQGDGQAQQAQQTEEYSGRRDPAPTQAVETVTEEQQGYFGQRFSFEAGVNYSHFDDARINLSGFLALDAIFLGQISVDEQTSDVITTDFTGRFAPTDRLQIDLNVPTIYRSSVFQSGGVGGDASGLADARVEEFGLGDISVGASYRLLRETVSRPDVVINTRIKAPTGKDPFGIELVEVEGTEGNFQVPTSLSTGSGAWAASVGASALKTLDPMVVFGNVTYFHNFKNEFDDIDEMPGDQPGTVDIGNAIQFGAGLAFALNEKSSISTSFSVRFGDEARLRFEGEEYQEVVGSGSTVGMLNLGATFAVSNRVSLLANVGVGMTTDAPDMVLSVRVPFRF